MSSYYHSFPLCPSVPAKGWIWKNTKLLFSELMFSNTYNYTLSVNTASCSLHAHYSWFVEIYGQSSCIYLPICEYFVPEKLGFIKNKIYLVKHVTIFGNSTYEIAWFISYKGYYNYLKTGSWKIFCLEKYSMYQAHFFSWPFLFWLFFYILCITRENFTKS